MYFGAWKSVPVPRGSTIDYKIKYKSINKLIKESEEFLLSIKNKSNEIKELICNFTTNLEIIENKNKIWMIITNDPIKNLQINVIC